MSETAVIIPCHNQADTLPRAIISALSADQIIVVDDCSSDDTAVIGQRFDEEYSHVIYCETGADVPAGVCFARNYGISFTSEDSLIIPLDADDKLAAGAIEDFHKHFVSGHFIYGGYIDETTYRTPPPIGMLDRKNVAQATFAFHKLMWKRVGGYDTDFNAGYEDWALMCALVERGYRPIRLDVAMHFTYGAGARSRHAKRYDKFLRFLLADKYPGVFQGVALHGIETH